jgi:glutamate 5-kinase
MASKVFAAKHAALRGIPTIIANGLKVNILHAIFEGKQEGTLFLPQPIPMQSRKHWIAFTKSPKGKIAVDEGAEDALLHKGKSLLPSGITAVYGRFSIGNSVTVVNKKEKDIAIGLVNYQSIDVEKVKGHKSSEIERLLGYKHEDEIIHKDNLVLLDE